MVVAEDPRVSARPSSQRRPGDFPDLRAVAYVARRGWWAILLAAVASAVLAEAAGSRGEVRYEATARLLIGPVLGDPAQVRAAEARVPTYAQLATSQRVVWAARARLRLRESVDALRHTVTAQSEGAGRLLTITAQATTAAGAARLANAIAAVLGPTVLGARRSAVREFHQVDPAVPPRGPIASHQRVLTAFAAVAGALACLTLLLVIEYFRGRITTGQELAEVTGAPLLVTLRTGRSAAGYDVLAARIALAGEGAPMRTILVTGDGVTDVADRLADAVEDAGEPVVRVTLPPTATPDAVRSAIEAERERRIVIDAPAPDRFPAGLTCAGSADTTILVARQGRSSRRPVVDELAAGRGDAARRRPARETRSGARWDGPSGGRGPPATRGRGLAGAGLSQAQVGLGPGPRARAASARPAPKAATPPANPRRAAGGRMSLG
jgi:capsular polysaccharide biosynthesis protein